MPDIPPEVVPPSATDTGLHSFIKLAITYMGIGIGMIALFFSAGVVSVPLVLGLPNNTNTLNLGYAFLAGLIILMLLTIYFLRKSRKVGAYLFFASVTLYDLQFIPYLQFLLFSIIPSGVVSGLLLTSFKYLR